MNDTLPKGWAEASIEDITQYVQRGKSPKYISQSDLPVINQKCIRWWGIDSKHLKFVDPIQWASWNDERFLCKGDILWNSTGTGTIGRAAIFGSLSSYKRIVADSHVTIVRTHPLLCIPKYLHFWISSPVMRAKLEKIQSGSTNQVELSRVEILSTQLPLPPLAEQKRIVAKLDALMERSSRARDELAHIPRLIERYKQAAISQAFINVQEEKLLNDCCSHVVDCLHSTAKFTPSGFRCIDTTCLGDNGLMLSKLRYVDDATFKDRTRRLLPQAGDIIFSREGTIGRSMVIPADFQFCLGQRMMMFRAKESVTPFYLHYYFHSIEFKKQLKKLTIGTTAPHVNIKDLRKVAIKIPSDLEEQKRIVVKIKNIFSSIDRLASELQRSILFVKRLDQSILDKAFQGELVAQNPDDEPSSVLLKRIQTSALTAAKVSSRGRKKA